MSTNGSTESYTLSLYTTNKHNVVGNNNSPLIISQILLLTTLQEDVQNQCLKLYD